LVSLGGHKANPRGLLKRHVGDGTKVLASQPTPIAIRGVGGVTTTVINIRGELEKKTRTTFSV